jgi:hypothetical protein
MASGGDLVAGFELADAFGAVRCVAVLDVARQCPGEGVPVDVVGVVFDELVDREEVAFDGVEVAGVGWRGDQRDAVGCRERADIRRPVGAEVVLDLVDPPAGRNGGADLGYEREVVAAAAVWPEPNAEAVVVDVVGADDVAGGVATVIGRALTLGASQGCPTGAGHRSQTDRAHLIKRDDMPAVGGRRGP